MVDQTRDGRPRRMLLRLALVGIVAVNAGAISVARAADGGADPEPASSVEVDASSAPPDLAVAELEQKTRDVRALTDGKLDPTIEPQSLFVVSLLDDNAVEVDKRRLTALLREVDRPPSADDAIELEATRRRAAKKQADAGPEGDAGAKGDAGLVDAAVEPARWSARIALDRARLAFYELPAARRRELLVARVAEQPDAAAPRTAAELREQEAERQRRAALLAAERARTEAERVVSSELARLLDVERIQAKVASGFADEKKQVAAQAEVTIGWQQRALEARENPGASADRTYEELRRALRGSRDALSRSLDVLGEPASAVPGPGPDPLGDLLADVDTSAVRKERDRVEAEAVRLRSEEQTIHRSQAAELFDQIDKLNGERLALLAALSPEKRRAVTGFTAAGWDQAASEARQLALILRYHRYIIVEWVPTLRYPMRAFGSAGVASVVDVVEWLLAFAAFWWWRRRSTGLLGKLRLRAEERDRRARRPAPSFATRALGFLVQVHRPAEWLALLFALRWFLPASTQTILEVRVVSVLMLWIFGAATIVAAIDALAGGTRREASDHDDADSAGLRLRSLRLVARVVVVFGLILVISAMLVGRGTIYAWVFSTCWLASIPVLLVLVRWWRRVVFVRTENLRKKGRLQRWVLANSEGFWTSFAAATVGGASLFLSGAARAARSWVGRFVIIRRALAYLFRRQLSRRELTGIVGPLPEAAYRALGPEASSTAWIANGADARVDELTSRIRQRRGGVIAIVGERGMGKSAALRRVQGERGDAILVATPSSDADVLRSALAAAAGLAPEASFEEAAAKLAASPALHAVLFDDAQRLVQPVLGGLATFDSVLAVASRHTRTTTWVFAFDRIIWQFLERSRGARPLFDEVVFLEPWREEEIVSILKSRTGEAQIVPSFENLLDHVSPMADETDRQDALAQSAADYYRLLWDAATGNPGVALHMWRQSIGIDADGRTVVRPAAALDSMDLERLPDPSVFVLRAVLQLAPARAEQIACGTLLRPAEVDEALRYAASRGYLEVYQGGYRVTWTWFRAITRFLQRKHLLTAR